MSEIKNNNEVQQRQISLVAKKQLLEKYNASDIIKIADNIYWMKDKEFWNINNFVNKNWELLFNVVWIIEDLWVNKYKELLKKLWYKWHVDNNWYYHIINIKTWKELPQDNPEYYEIFEILWKVDYRLDVTKNIFATDDVIKWKDSPQKRTWLELSKLVNDEILVWTWVEKWVIKPFEIHYLYHQKQLSDQEKYLKQTLTFKYLSNLINNQAIDLVWEQGSIPVKLDWKKYKITFWPITKEELDYYKAKKWINEKMYKELIRILEEQKKLEKKKQKEEKKHRKEVKKEISGLEDEVKKNLR